jgi:intracellular sulfur oxidation DsrE/DsrF family protein
MFNRKWSIVPCVTCLFLAFGAAYAGSSPGVKAKQALHIDIPAKLEKANVVFNIDRLELSGDLPIALGHLDLLVNDFSDLKAKGHIIAVFHTNAGHVTLDDKAYNAARHVTTGNPYKELLGGLMKKGVQVELCGATAKAFHWVNADLLPGVSVNTDAMVRLTQLGEEGYVQIKE